MSSDEVAALRRDMGEMMKSFNARLDTIHEAVLKLAGRSYVPGPPLMIWVKDRFDALRNRVQDALEKSRRAA